MSWEWVVWSRWCFWASSEWWGLWTKVSHLWEVLQPGGSGMEEKGRNPSLEITQLSNVWRVWFCCMRCVQTFLCLAAFGDLVFGCSAKAGTEMLRLGLPGCAWKENCVWWASRAWLGSRGLDCRSRHRFQGNLCGRGESMFKNCNF